MSRGEMRRGDRVEVAPVGLVASAARVLARFAGAMDDTAYAGMVGSRGARLVVRRGCAIPADTVFAVMAEAVEGEPVDVQLGWAAWFGGLLTDGPWKERV